MGLRWLARAFFAAALLAAGFGLWRRGQEAPLLDARGPGGAPDAVPAPPPGREKPLALDWSREPFREWASPEDGLRLVYPARFDEVRGFGRFTSRDLEGGLKETDVVAFRSMQPRSVILVAAYRSPRPLTWEEWKALACKSKVQSPGSKVPEPSAGGESEAPAEPPRSAQRPTPDAGSSGPKYPNTRIPEDPSPTPNTQHPTPFSAEFGGSDEEYRETRAGDRPALAVSARGALRYPLRGNDTMELWRFESLLVAEGDRAVRITAGVHGDHFTGARAGLERVLESFRWTPSPPKSPLVGREATRPPPLRGSGR